MPTVYLLSRYDSYDPLSKAPVCSLPEGVKRITVKEERALSGSTSLIAADGTLVVYSLHMGKADEMFFLIVLKRL